MRIAPINGRTFQTDKYDFFTISWHPTFINIWITRFVHQTCKLFIGYIIQSKIIYIVCLPERSTACIEEDMSHFLGVVGSYIFAICIYHTYADILICVSAVVLYYIGAILSTCCFSESVFLIAELEFVAVRNETDIEVVPVGIFKDTQCTFGAFGMTQTRSTLSIIFIHCRCEVHVTPIADNGARFTICVIATQVVVVEITIIAHEEFIIIRNNVILDLPFVFIATFCLCKAFNSLF